MVFDAKLDSECCLYCIPVFIKHYFPLLYKSARLDFDLRNQVKDMHPTHNDCNDRANILAGMVGMGGMEKMQTQGFPELYAG
jgi:hypothetical protein